MINLVEVQIKDFVESIRPPKHLRDKVDIQYTFAKNTLEIFEEREMWDNPNEKLRMPCVKARYIKTQQIWKIYWMRANEKWELYQTGKEISGLNEIFKIIKEDKDYCFFG